MNSSSGITGLQFLRMSIFGTGILKNWFETPASVGRWIIISSFNSNTRIKKIETDPTLTPNCETFLPLE